jgi:hypothetical protein
MQSLQDTTPPQVSGWLDRPDPLDKLDFGKGILWLLLVPHKPAFRALLVQIETTIGQSHDDSTLCWQENHSRRLLEEPAGADNMS